ncbi:MAG TPA: DUF5667 domain-containing protein [Pseudonocardiaceae bacterium]|nr:DUF5667 domain-containing protein [Pseudonocardiaceae bacterium]
MSSGRAPWWRQRQRERFARAADSLPEADQAPDPKLAGELAVVLMLRRAGEDTRPDDAARDRMRAKVFGQLAAESTAPVDPTVRRPSPVPRTASKSAPARPPKPAGSTRPGRVTGTRGRLAIAMGAVFCLVLALSGMTLLLARHALPGDALYGVRRTVESASLGLTSGDDGKGRKYLEFAADRIGDIESLAAQHPDPADSPVGDYLTAFADFDSEARAGTADLTGYATNHGDGVLNTLVAFAYQQDQRIEQVEPALPASVRTQVVASERLLARIVQRANGIAARNDCFTITSGATDDLGVLPATGPCDRPPSGSPAFGGAAATRSTEPNGGQGTATGTVGGSGSGSGGQAPVAPQDTTDFGTPTVVPTPEDTPPPLLPTTANPPGTLRVPLPLPGPGLSIPPLLPGLPGVGIGQ